MKNGKKINTPMANEKVSQHIMELLEAISEQSGKDVVASVFFVLTKDKQTGLLKWISISNYREDITDMSLLYLYDAVHSHIKSHFLSE